MASYDDCALKSKGDHSMDCVARIEISPLRIGENYSIHLSISRNGLPSKIHLTKYGRQQAIQ